MVKICIIGGGAAGLTAAVASAKELNAGNIKYDIVVLERMDRVGKKILATGNGRCNLSNKFVSAKNYYGANIGFVERALCFGFDETVEFFNNIGLLCNVEADGKVYPYSYQASAVLDVLRLEASRLNVREVCGFEVSKIKKKSKEFVIHSATGDNVTADKIIICTGGAAHPALGSNGSGYRLLTELGHTCTNIYPALVQLKLKSEAYNFNGIRTQAAVKITNANKTLAESKGELLFTEYGVSGICVMEISRVAGKFFVDSKNESKLLLHIDLLPEFSNDELYKLLTERKTKLSERYTQDFFTGMINKKIGVQILKGINADSQQRQINTLSERDILSIIKCLKNRVSEITGTMGFGSAQVTGGGINCQEFTDNMESKIINGIYVAGEIFDVLGDCGGFNLQWAWTTGHIAGKSAAKSIQFKEHEKH